ncbi:MAG: rod shape-determining protein MreD [Chitinophagaceae bacterium]|nr:rod shape-determining protein MreD [Bacteroidota bacterium]MCC6258858.1 rod shape-determining protein MreD [Chitinophagaceae bacterium]MCW5916091.1 rod shape-determining protein MreD [Ferruginibacter sp.]
MATIPKNIIRFVLLVLIQTLVLDNIRLHQMITPYIYFLFILWLPFRINRTLLMILAACLGFAIDSFRHHPGFHMAACVLIAYLRPFIINLLISQEDGEANYDEPSVKSMGGLLPYSIYAGILSLLHNAWLFLLEAWQFGDAWYFISKTVLSTLVTLALILLAELVVNRKQKFRTNTA